MESTLKLNQRISALARRLNQNVFGGGRQDTLLDKILWVNLVILNSVLIFSTALSQMAAATLFFILIYRMSRQNGRTFTKTSLDLPVAAFFAARAISILLSTDLSRSLPAVYKELPFYLMFFAFTNSIDIGNRARVGILIKVLIFSAIVAATIGIIKYSFKIDERASSTTSGYYTLGIFLITAMAFGLTTGQFKDVFRDRAFWNIGYVICAVAVILTFNRIHWIALILFVFATGMTMNRRLLLYATTVCILAFLLVPNVRTRIEDVSSTTTLTGREVIWRAAIEKSGNHPVFGYGPRTFPTVFTYFSLLEDKKVGSWHNDALEIYMESGAVGLLAYLWLVVMAVFILGKALLNKRLEPFYRYLAGGLFLAISGHLMSGLTGVFIADPLASLLFKECLALTGLVGFMSTRIKNDAKV